MALAAIPQSALPSWDETIVPALRKRLEGESRVLANRMSVASISSLDEAARPNIHATPDKSLPDYSMHRKYVPALKAVAPKAAVASPGRHDLTPSNRVNGAPSIPSSSQRSRTHSQPYSHNLPFSNGHVSGVVLSTPDSSRSGSPMYHSRPSDVKPTRIPIVARGRTSSTSSHLQNTSLRNDAKNKHGLHQPPTPEATPDLWAVEEGAYSDPSLSTVSVPSPQRSGILSEPAPFNSSSLASSVISNGYEGAYDDRLATRPSTDSEERPFEHWYRGDVYRNGGVGELRVGKRMEMLEIANFGHSIKKKTHRSASRDSSALDTSHRRRRADSVVGIGARESFYLDEERAKQIAMVLHEKPLMDSDIDADTDQDMFYDVEEPNSKYDDSPPIPPPIGEHSRSSTPTTFRVGPTRIPMPRQNSEQQRAATPTQMLRTATEPPLPSASSSHSGERTIPRSSTHPKLSPHALQSSQNTTPVKRRAKSPASSPSSMSKRPKPQTRSPAATFRQDKDVRRSISEYPTPVGDDVVDAIPSWTQPVPKSGNWDEVVLPVVARKKGLDGLYEKADGSPRIKQPQTNVFEPAPGTFGYDHSKYRQPNGDIPMDEFGRRPEDISPQMNESAQRPHKEASDSKNLNHAQKPHNFHDTIPRARDSPLPFAQYARPDSIHPIPAITVTKPTLDQGHEDEDAGGCCKCVIM